MRRKPAAFPVGLYGMLLFALCWLTLPAVFAPLERVLVGTACCVPRIAATWLGMPAHAASPEARRALDELGTQLDQRVRAHDASGAAVLGSQREPVFCAVLDTPVDKSRRGGAGQPSELLLDHSYAELAGCAEYVTKGDALIGFLQRPGVGIAAEDGPDDPARVMLCNHRAARPVYAAMTLPEGGVLRLVVKAAAVVDPAPLRAELWDDPYRAARLEQNGQLVHTLAVADSAAALPAGLALGRTRIWGYAQEGDVGALTIGVYVQPPIEPRAISHVVVWRERGAEPAVARRASVHARPATVYDLPGAANGRHLLVVGEAVPDGAAVVDDGLFLGTARGLMFGVGLMSSFVASRHRWSLVLLPDDPLQRPREIDAEVVQSSGATAWLRWRGEQGLASPARLPAGYLFTGSNGAHCPAGLWIGRAEPHPVEHDLLRVTTPAERGPRRAQVLVDRRRT